MDYYNGHHLDEPPIQLSNDFTDDVAERNMPTEYVPNPPKG